jgi:hypothetical protein
MQNHRKEIGYGKSANCRMPLQSYPSVVQRETNRCCRWRAWTQNNKGNDLYFGGNVYQGQKSLNRWNSTTGQSDEDKRTKTRTRTVEVSRSNEWFTAIRLWGINWKMWRWRSVILLFIKLKSNWNRSRNIGASSGRSCRIANTVTYRMGLCMYHRHPLLRVKYCKLKITFREIETM